MKQVLQDLGDGKTHLAEVPAPKAGRGRLLVRTRRSLLSAGTERMLVDFGRAGWIDKARQQPEKVRMVRDKIRSDGLLPTIDAIRGKLDRPIPLGYSNVGVVEAVGPDSGGFAPGDRVVSNGSHAELVVVPKNLCARVPDEVTDDEATFTVIGSIALQGIRLANPSLGECVVVTGLGLIGLMAVQLLTAHGCRVLGIDPDPGKRTLAAEFGAEVVDPSDEDVVLSAARRFSRGRGVDAVLLTLASRRQEPVSQAARMCRKRGRVVLVGVTGLELNRSDFYEKEISFQVSCSYGPGRYDSNYEDEGQDYPVGFVRWTAQRNFEAVLDSIASRRLRTQPLVSHRFDFADAPRAYDLLVADEPSLGIVFDYRADSPGPPSEATVALASEPASPGSGTAGVPRVSFLGAGNYAGRILIPAFREAGAMLSTVVTGSGVNGAHYGRKYGFRQASTDADRVWTGEDDAVVVATRHDSHADFVVRGLRAGKHVFVEKPLALTHEEVDSIERAARDAPDRVLMVGYNRRFAPQIERIRSLLQAVSEPKSFQMTVNAGAVPRDHWVQDPDTGGGRIVGEACHFIDLLRHLADAEITGWDVSSLPDSTGGARRDDCCAITLRFADGSFGVVQYLANGHKAVSKERLEVFCQGRVLQLDNYRTLRGHGWSGFRHMNLWRQDKGQRRCPAAFLQALRDGVRSPIPLEELLEIGRVSIDVAEAARRG